MQIRVVSSVAVADKKITSQIKTAIDRFYQFSFPKGRETLHIKDLYLIAASANPDSAMFNDVVHAYEQLCELLHFDKGGTLLCPGLAGADDLENHQEFLEKAVKMGMAI